MKKTELILETPGRIKPKKIAVILTSYGRDTLLVRAIESVLGQSFTDFLVFIVDDNSPEKNKRTQPIISTYADKDERIIYFRTLTTEKERKARSTFCRNINIMLKLIKENNIKYTCYLPCDDYFHPNRLKSAVKFLDKSEQPSCWNYVRRIDQRGKGHGLIPSTGMHNMYRAVSILDHNCVTHRLDVLDKLAYPYWPLDKSSEHQAPDGIFFNKLIQVSGPIAPISREVLGYKTIHSDSIQGRAYRW